MSGFDLPPLIGSQRALGGSQRLVGEGVGRAALPGGDDIAGSAFGDALTEQISRVGSLQQQVTEDTKAMAMGDFVGVDKLMLSIGKSETAFNLMLEVRNKLVDAWEKLSRSVV